MTIKKGDNIIVLSGKDKGKQATVVDIMRDKDRVLIEGVNVFKKHQRPRQEGKKGQVVERAMPLHLSNVAVYCSKCKKGARLAVKMDGDKKLRVCRTCDSKL